MLPFPSCLSHNGIFRNRLFYRLGIRLGRDHHEIKTFIISLVLSGREGKHSELLAVRTDYSENLGRSKTEDGFNFVIDIMLLCVGIVSDS